MFAINGINIKSISVSLFTVVQFRNKECEIDDETGICLSDVRCEWQNGHRTVPCAFGFGTCCLSKLNSCAFFIIYINMMSNWRPPSLSELIPMIFNTGLTHLGPEAFD